MRKAAGKDILRTIWKEKKRFISIMLITTLGVTMMTGLSAGCEDLRSSADYFFDEQKLFDISVLSTLGLTQEDVEVLASLEGVEAAEGSYSEIVHTKKGDVNKTAEVKTVWTGGMNLPYVVEGELPSRADQIAVTGNYITDTGKRVGDKVIIEEMIEEGEESSQEAETEAENGEEAENKITLDKEVNLEEEAETPNFLYTEYTISGVVVDAMDINNADGSAAFRATPNADYTFFVLPEAIDSEVYTAVYLSMEGTEGLLCYSAEYEEKITELVSRIEGEIKEQREQARYDAITDEAYDKINEAEVEMNEAFADAEKEFADAEEEIAENWQEIADSKREIADGKQEIADGKQQLLEKEQEVAAQIADARAEIAEGYEQLEEGQREINEAASQLYEGNLAMAQGRAELEEKEAQFKEEIAQAEATLAANQSQNEAAKVTVATQVEQVSTSFGAIWPGEAWNSYVSALTQVMLPLIQGQMSSGQSSMTPEQQQALAAALQSNPIVIQAGQDFGTALGIGLGEAAAQLQMQAAELQNGLAEVEKQVTAQETVITDLETRIGQETDQNILTELQTQLSREKEVKAALEKERDGLNEKLLAVNPQLQAIQEQITNMNQLVTDISQLAMGVAQTEAVGQLLHQAAETLASQKAAAEAQIAAAWEEIQAGEAQLAEATRQIHEGRAKLEENRQKLEDAARELEKNEQNARQEFADARIEIENSEKELLEGEEELRKGEEELLEGEQELADGRLEYEEEKARAQDKIAEAKAEVKELDMTQWYVQDRTSLSGYVNVESDTLSIESLASVFTVVFFVVAILISLTTVTRMVEEERGLIGTYKALGFTDHEIRKKYVVYALWASVAGGVLGDFCGFVVLPEILFMFFKVMYLFPDYLLQFDFASGTISIFLFMLGIIGAAVWACESELKHLPAQLMRPKAPKMGSKVLLERVTFIWKRFSFLNKVTARNLFRYKKRLLMTILGISGCTALVLFGFAIKDSVAELMPLQYERVYKYDLLAATTGEDNDKLLDYMAGNEEIKEYLNIQVESVKLKNLEGDTEKVQIMIFPEGADSTSYVTLTNVEEKVVGLAGEGIYLTENAAKILGLKKGDTALIQNMDLVQKEVRISEVVKNYLGNNIYMSQKAYGAAFGGYEPNGVLANLADSCQDQIGFSDTLAMEDWIISSVSTQELKEGFSAAFTLINIVVYVVLVLAAGLAFVVLFTLANTNISERIRELATIKVLGFFDREVHSYVNKETLILTGIGILLGLPVGAAISSTLTDILDMPSIYFAVTIYPKSFFISAGVSLVFALMVQFLTDRSLDKIDMVEALKSVE